jgi:hypothetical protein
VSHNRSAVTLLHKVNSELPRACKISIVPNKDCGVDFVKLSRSCVTFNLKSSKTDKHSIWLIHLLYRFYVYQWYGLSNSELPCACKIFIHSTKQDDCGIDFVKLSRSCVTFNLKSSKTGKHSIWLIHLSYRFYVYQWYKLITLLQIQT